MARYYVNRNARGTAEHDAFDPGWRGGVRVSPDVTFGLGVLLRLRP